MPAEFRFWEFKTILPLIYELNFLVEKLSLEIKDQGFTLPETNKKAPENGWLEY